MSSIFRLFSVSYLEQLNNDLYQAAAVGDAKMVECILSYGVSPNVHYSSLNLNVGRKNSKESTQLLLKHGAEIKARNGNNKTPLHCAAENNSTESAKLLLERDAEIEARDANNNTPLYYAAENYSSDSAEPLLKRGAETEARGAKNNSPLHYTLEEIA